MYVKEQHPSFFLLFVTNVEKSFITLLPQLFPGLMLFEKLLQSFQSVARYLYIFCEKLMNLCCNGCLCFLLFFGTLVFTGLVSML